MQESTILVQQYMALTIWSKVGIKNNISHVNTLTWHWSIILGNPLAQVRVPQVVTQLQLSFLLWFCQESLRTIVNVLNESWWKWIAQLHLDSYISQPVTHSYSTDVHNYLILPGFHPSTSMVILQLHKTWVAYSGILQTVLKCLLLNFLVKLSLVLFGKVKAAGHCQEDICCWVRPYGSKNSTKGFW